MVFRGGALLATGLVLLGAATVSYANQSDSAEIYRARCAACHETPQDRTPPRSLLSSRSVQDIVSALTSGRMSGQATGLSGAQILGVAEFLTSNARLPVTAAPSPIAASPGSDGPSTGACTVPPPEMTIRESDWNGWGRDLANSRYQPNPGITERDVPRLKPKWVFAYPGTSAWGQPTVVGGRVYVSSRTGQVYSLDAKTGCTYWIYEPGGRVRSAIVIAPVSGNTPRYAAYFGNDHAEVFAVDAITGVLLWKAKVDDFPTARITGSPTAYAGTIYVPVSSLEETLARAASYECCKFRGSVVALDAATGNIRWRTYTIPEEPKPYVKASAKAQSFGPAGAAVWSAPTVDPKRGLLYVGTGNSYTELQTHRADSIIALDLASGEARWSWSPTTGDNYLSLCSKPGVENCPDPLGSDFDFGASPVLQTLDSGHTLLIAAQKSGAVYALDPEREGSLVWQQRLSKGGLFGGIEWGVAVDHRAVFVPISDASSLSDPSPGFNSIAVAGGERLWSSPSAVPACSWGSAGCSRGQSQAVTAMPDVVFSGALDGHLRAYRASDGSILWDFDTAADSYVGVNGGTAHGGSLDYGGPAIVDGMLYINSGYVLLSGHSGNALIAFSVGGQ